MKSASAQLIGWVNDSPLRQFWIEPIRADTVQCVIVEKHRSEGIRRVSATVIHSAAVCGPDCKTDHISILIEKAIKAWETKFGPMV